ncbi:MAG: hypothetical protein U0N27_08685, partial [Massilistercora timonensis]
LIKVRLKYPVIHFSFQNSFPVRIFLVFLQVYEGVSQLPIFLQKGDVVFSKIPRPQLKLD